ncbi:MAG: hypothetical protein QNL12_05315 [Acidimicrobiia bacterium]|nr:hypothetical protein [Acidimicrobiia bacterium]MDX2466711.1 hypothetical protein [Acidimicrobiia bacterium]
MERRFIFGRSGRAFHREGSVTHCELRQSQPPGTAETTAVAIHRLRDLPATQRDHERQLHPEIIGEV